MSGYLEIEKETQNILSFNFDLKNYLLNVLNEIEEGKNAFYAYVQVFNITGEMLKTAEKSLDF